MPLLCQLIRRGGVSVEMLDLLYNSGVSLCDPVVYGGDGDPGYFHFFFFYFFFIFILILCFC